MRSVISNTPRPLPRGPHRLAREEVAASQRGRLLDAMAHAVATRVYGAATVADVIERAGVSRKTFYEHFRDKEDCFLAAYDLGAQVLLQALREAVEGVDGALERVRASVRAYLEILAAEPAFARTFVIEVGAAGPRALERRRQVLREFAALTRELTVSAGFGVGVPEQAYLAATGAVNEVVADCIAEGGDLRALEDALIYVNAALLAGSAG